MNGTTVMFCAACRLGASAAGSPFREHSPWCPTRAPTPRETEHRKLAKNFLELCKVVGFELAVETVSGELRKVTTPEIDIVVDQWAKGGA